jgi:hypothetical protein
VVMPTKCGPDTPTNPVIAITALTRGSRETGLYPTSNTVIAPSD